MGRTSIHCNQLLLYSYVFFFMHIKIFFSEKMSIDFTGLLEGIMKG